ncbi:MAG: helix-turn-helix domain-containing protein [Candidatus Cybelea sp.]
MITSRIDTSRFGELLRELRIAAGLSQEALAERAAMSVNGISALERGENRSPQRKTLALLVRALGLEPDEERALEQAAVRHSRPRRASYRASGIDVLPRISSPFFGREHDVETALALAETNSLVTLTGTGGVGKTRLAIQIAQESPESFADGIRFVDLAPLRDSAAVTSAVCARFAVKGSGERPARDLLVDELRPKQALLILDNCEHLVDAVASLAQALIGACPELRIIATSRQSLKVPGEQIFPVLSLELDACIALFADRAKRATGRFLLSDENRDAIARIVRGLDGIALAIELAAARMNFVTLEQLELRLSESLHYLTGGSSLMVPRQQTMRATIDWSYELLDPQERRIFAALSVFPASFSLDAAVAVCDDAASGEWRIFEVLASLVDKSLVVGALTGNVARYRLLETVRAYAAERTAADEIAWLQRRHAAYYAALAEDAEGALASAESTIDWAKQLEPDLESLRTALDWSLARDGDVVTGARILTRLQEFWITQGLALETNRRAQAALRTNAEIPPSLRAALWLTLARMRQELFKHPGVMLEAASHARELYESAGDQAGLALALRQQGAAQMRLALYAEARHNFERSIGLQRGLGDRRMVARGLGYLASLLLVQREYAQARTTLAEVLETLRELGDDRMIPTASMNLAEAEFALGEYANAAARAGENLARISMHKGTDMRATQEANLSVYLLALGRNEEARGMALASLQDAVGSFIAVPLQHLAAIIAADVPKRAATLIGYVETIFEAMAFSRENTERYSHERLMTELRSRLTEDEISQCLCEGAALNESEVIKLAREETI